VGPNSCLPRNRATGIIAGLLGLPEKDYPQFQRWSISLLRRLMNPERGLAAPAALRDYFAPSPRTT
jgi:cytochrome P450